MKKIHALALAGVSLAMLGACATKPKTAEVVKTPEVAADANSGASTGTVDTGATGAVATQADAKLGDRVYFDLNGNDLDSDDQVILKQHAERYAADPAVRILVAGNCDERGTREYNLALGERRAATVKDYLVSLGFDAARIDTISYGKERPVAAGSDEQAWALNRNGFIQIVDGKSS